MESVEEMTQPKQIAKAAKHARAGAVISARGSAATLTLVPVGPLGWNEGATSVGEAGQHEENALAPDTANDRERAALKWVTLAGNRYRSREISAMGSLSPLPSTTVSHEWLICSWSTGSVIGRIIRLIQKWLRAGVLEDGIGYGQ